MKDIAALVVAFLFVTGCLAPGDTASQNEESSASDEPVTSVVASGLLMRMWSGPGWTQTCYYDGSTGECTLCCVTQGDDYRCF